MKRYITYHFLALLLLAVQPAYSQRHLKTDVLIVGAGASGTAAAIQCARMGVSTILVSENQWLGGMITAAGVSAFDGNHNMPSGIWAEFREQLYKVYGGPSKVATGWVSNTLFEPHVGDSVFKAMVAPLSNLTILYRHRFEKTIVRGTKVKGAFLLNETTKQRIRITAAVVIDATELGDVMAGAGIPFDVGMEAGSLTGEDVNVPESNDIIQDITWVAILKDYGLGADRTIARPPNYDPMEFDGCCNEFCSSPEKLTSNVSAQKMLDYGKLPNGKYMINWPGKGNDIYLNVIPLTHEQRQEELKKAKAKTLRFLYFLQTQFGFKHLDLADDEFPTEDKLALIPYHRESRRLHGLVRFKIQHISKPFDQPEALYRTGIAVGDYPIDHHHRENPKAPQHLGFYPVPSYNLPIGVMIPQKHKGIIVAEKSTSISNVVNGTTRLQPIVVLTGQAAGTLAAMCVKENKQPQKVGIRQVQQQLLNDGAYIMPYFDVKPTHPHFAAIQRIGATGILKGIGEPYQWANRTWFYPDSTVQTAVFLKDASSFVTTNETLQEQLTVGNALLVLQEAMKQLNIRSATFDRNDRKLFNDAIKNAWIGWGLTGFREDRPITRAELAVLLDQVLQPFQLKQINHKGQFLN